MHVLTFTKSHLNWLKMMILIVSQPRIPESQWSFQTQDNQHPNNVIKDSRSFCLCSMIFSIDLILSLLLIIVSKHIGAIQVVYLLPITFDSKVRVSLSHNCETLVLPSNETEVTYLIYYYTNSCHPSRGMQFDDWHR